jgi:hypothetical protein
MRPASLSRGGEKVTDRPFDYFPQSSRLNFFYHNTVHHNDKSLTI